MWQIKILFITVFLLGIVYADIPPAPDKFSGNVTINNTHADIGTQIEVYVNNEYTQTHTLDLTGYYILYVKEGNTNEQIEFKIQNITVGKSSRVGGAMDTLNLAIGSCVEEWSCNEWSQCSNNFQTRQCNEHNNCGTLLNKPTESQDCSSDGGNSGGGGSGNVGVTENKQESKPTQQETLDKTEEEKQVTIPKDSTKPNDALKEVENQVVTNDGIVITSQPERSKLNLFSALFDFFKGNSITGAVVGDRDYPPQVLVGIIIILLIVIPLSIIGIKKIGKRKNKNA